MRKLLFALVFILPLSSWSASREIPGKTLTFIVSAEPLANLLYQLDCVTEISSCSRHVFETAWLENIGPLGNGSATEVSEDQKWVMRWRAIKKKYQGSFQFPIGDGHRIISAVPPREEGFDLRHKLQIAQMSAKNLEDLQGKFDLLMEPRDARNLVLAAAHFQGKFDTAWKVKSEPRMNSFIDQMVALTDRIHLLDFFETVASFLSADIPPQMKFYFHLIARPESENQNSTGEQIENHSFIEVTPKEEAVDRIDVISHEAFHFFYYSAPIQQHLDLIKRFADSTVRESMAAYNLINESLATVLGNGLVWEKARGTDAFQKHVARKNSFYLDDGIDSVAKAMLPLAKKYLAERRTIYSAEFVPDYLRAYAAATGKSAQSPRYLLKNMELIVAPVLEGIAQPLVDQLGCNSVWGFRPDEGAAVDRLARYPDLNAVIMLPASQLDQLEPFAKFLGDEFLKLKLLAKKNSNFIYGIERNAKSSIFIFVSQKNEDAKKLNDQFLKQTQGFVGQMGPAN